MPDRNHKFDGAFGACSGCGKYVEELIDERYCSGTKTPASGFDEDHSIGMTDCDLCAGSGEQQDGSKCQECGGSGSRQRSGRHSIKRSHRAEGRNWVD